MISQILQTVLLGPVGPPVKEGGMTFAKPSNNTPLRTTRHISVRRLKI